MAQEQQLLAHCGHARYVWNLAIEQHSWWTPRRGPAPSFAVQCRQLTEARAAFAWLRDGSVNVQQQALRDFAQAMRNLFNGTHRRPTWRKAGMHEGFRVTDTCKVERLSRKWAQVAVPKVGWVRFRWTRPIGEAKSYRITRDRAGRWHVAFAVIPEPIPAPGSGTTVGVDRGVTVSAALSTGETLHCPVPSRAEAACLARLQRRLVKAKRGSNRRGRLKAAIAKLKARHGDRRRDWIEKTSTDLARRFDRIAFEDLKVCTMTRSAKGTLEAPGKRVRQKAGLNRSILEHAWGRLLQRTGHKAPDRVVLVPAPYTSQRCSACGFVVDGSRESQSVFVCKACGYAANADVNAARNVDTAAGHAVVLRGEGTRTAGPKNREPQLLAALLQASA
jgi:transposase